MWARRERDPAAIEAAQQPCGACDSRRVTLVHWDDVEASRRPPAPAAARRPLAASRRCGGQRARRRAPRAARTRADDHAAAHAYGRGGDLPRARRLGDAVAGREDVRGQRGRHDRARRRRRGAHADRRRRRPRGAHLRHAAHARARVSARARARSGSPMASVTAIEAHPWDAEAALGTPGRRAGERPPNVVALGDVEGDYGGMWKRRRRGGRREAERPQLGAAAAERGGRAAALPLGRRGGLRRSSTARAASSSGDGREPGKPPRDRARSRAIPSATGHVVSRPAGHRALALPPRRARSRSTYLAYGTREPNDVCYYPRSNKIFFRGLGLIARLEPLDYSTASPGRVARFPRIGATLASSSAPAQPIAPLGLRCARSSRNGKSRSP